MPQFDSFNPPYIQCKITSTATIFNPLLIHEFAAQLYAGISSGDIMIVSNLTPYTAKFPEYIKLIDFGFAGFTSGYIEKIHCD